MRVLVTGGSGQVGRFVLARLVEDGHGATALCRRPVGLPGVGSAPWSLDGADEGLPEADALVHCALDHVAGAYRGGEGADPEGFRRRNLDGSLRLFAAAKRAGVARCLFLSSRAIYGSRAGPLREDDAARPDTLYGEVKLSAERALEAMTDEGFRGAALRATGVYGLPPGLERHKWSGLFEAYLRGETVAPRCGTEVHGADLAAAVAMLLAAPPAALSGAFNVSDVLVDRHDLLDLVQARTGARHPPPARADPDALGVMDTGRLRALGWRPRGAPGLRDFVRGVALPEAAGP